MVSWQLLIGTVMCVLLGSTTAEPLPLTYIQQDIEVGGVVRVVTIPAGYKLEVLATRLAQPRMLSFGRKSELFIGSRSGRVYRLTPPYQEYTTLIRVSGYPHSVVQRGGQLFIARTDSLLSIDYTTGQQKLDGDDAKVLLSIPGGGGTTPAP